MPYELYYWPGIPGRGEFVRLALEQAGTDYVDVAREPDAEGRGPAAVFRYLEGADVERPPFAPPFLKAGEQVIAQTAAILFFLGDRHALAPADEAGRLWALQLQLTVTDFVAEIHDTHHPVGAGLYYEEQKPESKRRADEFRHRRLPRFLDYFEDVIHRNPGGDEWIIGTQPSHVDLSLFQVTAGLRYAFPVAMARLEDDYPLLTALHDRVRELPHVRAYLASDRRQPFNDDGIFRHYEELDG